MKKFLLLTLAVCSFLGSYAQHKPIPESVEPVEVSPFNLNVVNPPSVLENFAKRNGSSRPATTAAKSTTFGRQQFGQQQSQRRAEAVQYLAAAQNHQRDYRFVYNGGPVTTYNIGVAVDGDQVTFENFFNFGINAGQYYTLNGDVPFTGTYDEAAGTITVPAATNFATGTVVGQDTVSNYYTGILLVGKANESGTLTPDENLVLHVNKDADGNIERIYSKQFIAVANYSSSGVTYGNGITLRGIVIQRPKAGSQLYSFNDKLSIGEGFPNDIITGSVDVVNLGLDATSYAIEVESDPEGYVTTTTAAGEIASGGVATIDFALQGTEVAELVEANALITYEDGDDEGQLVITIDGSVVPTPDYSAAVKAGSESFTFRTNIDAPFQIVESDGAQWAKSGLDGAAGTSDLYLDIEVPEGHVGTLSWTGKHENDPSYHYSYLNYVGWFIDSETTAYSSNTAGDQSSSIELAPGKHTVRFQYQAYYYAGIPNNGFYLKDIDLQFQQLDADAAELQTPALAYGSFLLKPGYGVEGTQNIQIQNRGANPLTVVSAASDNDEFTIDSKVEPVPSLGVLTIPVSFYSETAGEKTANLTIETSAGTFTVAATAQVTEYPDFSQIVTEGLEYMDITTDESNPFIIQDGIAFNANWNQPDTQYGYSSFTLNLNIPEGKVGYLTWEGRTYGYENQNDPNVWDHYYADRAVVDYQNNNMSGSVNIWCYDAENGSDASSDAFNQNAYYENSLTFIPVTQTWFSNRVSFQYFRDGDGTTYGKSRFEVSNIRLHVVDFEPHQAELLDERVEFDSTYVGTDRYTTATVRLRNTGSAVLSVDSIKAETEGAPFYGIVPTGYNNEVNFNGTLSVTLWFYPGEIVAQDTRYTDNIIIYTNAGEFKVAVTGVARGNEGILLVGDFEDNAYGWTIYDADGDGSTWNLGTNLWYQVPEYVHGGIQCLASISGSSYDGNLEPDNWTFSYAVNVPEDGAVLTWYAAAHHHERYAEHYSVYVDTDFNDAGALSSKTPIFSETLPAEAADEWQFHAVELPAELAGQTVYVAFRHHDTFGQYILKLDDVFLYTKSKWEAIQSGTTVGVSPAAVSDVQDVVLREFYNAAGQRVDAPQKGINVVRAVMKDGSIRSKKFIVK